MSLITYKQKRKFSKTPEPSKKGKTDGERLRFVVQKHAASHLHYDFRLEMEGVLKSWAVPKGPSMDPEVKRLAMMVEDHPYDYRSFEGTIPEGNYGAGTVMVWDEGFYEPMESDSANKTGHDKELRHQLHVGKIKFVLKGKKLKGAFALVKARGRGENGWLLMKLKDKHTVVTDVLLKDRSVLSKKTMDGITRSAGEIIPAVKKINKSLTSTAQKAKAVVKRKKKVHSIEQEVAELIKLTNNAPPSKFPISVKPMLATLVDKPFDVPGWLYEIKWDGYRTVSLIKDHIVELKSRNDKSFNEKFYPVYNALGLLNIQAVLDGEIVVIDEKGLSNFGALQNWRSEADGHLLYYVFDIIWLDGKDLSNVPLTIRKEILKRVLLENEIIRVSENFDVTGKEFYEGAKRLGLEGIIAKRANSFYYSGTRTNDWLKIKVNKRQEVIIGGYTRNEDSSKLFSSLLVGVYENHKLNYTGKIGTGFTDKLQGELMQQFKSRIVKQSPFNVVPDVNKASRFRPNPPKAEAVWLKPELVCEVSFIEMTSDGVMRHASFEGMRSDKKPSEVILEKEVPINKAIASKQAFVDQKVIQAAPKAERKTLLNPTDESQVRKLNGHELKFTNLSKVFWPEQGITKRDMINYYYQVAPYILPYLKDRPQSLNRFPNGIYGKSFYQKDVTGKVPEWVDTFLYHSNEEETDKHFMVPKDEAGLLLMVNLGCIELNPWSSRIQNPDNPDWCIIDLDPDKNHFDQVIEAARVTKEILDDLKVPSYCKTSGSTGLHIYIPLGGKYSYEQSKEFARVVVTLVHHQLPKFTSIERQVSKRGGKMYLDFLQNRPKATLAAPYSLRPKPGATVSMPLHWEEVKKGLSMKDFTIFNAVERARSVGDIFLPVLGKGINLDDFIKRYGQR